MIKMLKKNQKIFSQDEIVSYKIIMMKLLPLQDKPPSK